MPFIWFAVLLGIIHVKLLLTFSFKDILYSDNLKLSVVANIVSFHSIFIKIQAKVGLIFHSAEEKRVFSIDFFIILHFKVKLVSSFIFGINGNSEELNHLIFIFQLSVLIFTLSSELDSISIKSSFIKLMYQIKSLLGIHKDPSFLTSKSVEITCSIAISKLFAVRIILLYVTFNNIFSRIGVVVIDAVA